MEVPAYYADPTLFVLKGGKVLAIVASRSRSGEPGSRRPGGSWWSRESAPS
jgi:hypothetical protein